jgi:hypothetical protein
MSLIHPHYLNQSDQRPTRISSVCLNLNLIQSQIDPASISRKSILCEDPTSPRLPTFLSPITILPIDGCALTITEACFSFKLMLTDLMCVCGHVIFLF